MSKTKDSTSFSSKAFDLRMKKIDKAIEGEDWFSAFALVGAYFEHYSYWAIRFYCHSAKIKLTQKAVESLKMSGASELILYLLLVKLIDDDTYSKMKIVIKERNKIVHPTKEGISYANPNKKQKDEFRRILNEAKDFLLLVKSIR